MCSFNIMNDLEKISLSSPIHFISAGVCCHAIALLDRLGIIDKILAKEFSLQSIKSLYNPVVIQSAISTLEVNNIIKIQDEKICFTDFGLEIISHRGSIGLIYDGYRHILSNQLQIYTDQINNKNNLIDSEAIVTASVSFGKSHIDHLIQELVNDLPIEGTICDFGCGDGSRLAAICELKKCKGLGLEISKEAYEIACDKNDPAQLSFILGNTAEISFVRNDVSLLMQYFCMHDIVPTSKCIEVIRSFYKCFPKFNHFIFVDVVAPSQTIPSQLPGFDYVHSLLDISARNYEETIAMFQECDLQITKEIAVPGLPNTFIWLLTPSRDDRTPL